MSRHERQAVRGDIHLGDLARALQALTWHGDKEAQTIANCLGFGRRAEGKHSQTETSGQQLPSSSEPGSPTSQPAKDYSRSPEAEPPLRLPDYRAATELKSLGHSVSPHPAREVWLDDAPTLYDDGKYPAMARATLLPEPASRHIITTALATHREGPDINMQALVDDASRLNPIRSIPRLREATLERGCQLLLDYSPSMVPFWEDLIALRRQGGQVSGRESLEVHHCNTQPPEARSWLTAHRHESRSKNKRPILVATDLGIKGAFNTPPLSASWLEFVAACKEGGSPLLILIPWPRARWPEFPGGYPTLIHWNSRTTVAGVRQRIGADRVLAR